jgi:hypothetical protein
MKKYEVAGKIVYAKEEGEDVLGVTVEIGVGEEDGGD